MEDKIEESFYKQANMLADDCLRDFSDAANRVFAKDKKMDQIKEEKNKVVERFSGNLSRICYREDWEQPRVDTFKVELEKKYSQLMVKIINDSIK